MNVCILKGLKEKEDLKKKNWKKMIKIRTENGSEDLDLKRRKFEIEVNLKKKKKNIWRERKKN